MKRNADTTAFAKRAAALALSAALALHCALPVLAGAADGIPTASGSYSAAEDRNGTTVYPVRTAADLVELQKLFVLDSASRGVTVLLEADIDLKGSGFAGIPVFCGSFNGQGHTISGLKLTESGNGQGLFRYVEEGASVGNLRVEGELKPTDRRNLLGGIAAVNRGLIHDCSFSGVIEGKNEVGGLVGRNEATGTVQGCTNLAGLQAERMVGGVVGQNLGVVSQCTNRGAVNVQEVKATLGLDDLDMDRLNSTENIPVTTDIGGVVGLSAGVVQSCTNEGPVGFETVGYNVGGVCGRTSGFVGGCYNSGPVQGRRDVGGVCGQLEPEMTLKYDTSKLDTLYDQLDELERLMNRTMDDASGSSSAVSGQLTSLTSATQTTKNNVKALSDSLMKWTDETSGSINNFSASVSDALRDVPPLLEDARKVMDELQAIARDTRALLDDTESVKKLGEQTARQLEQACKTLEAAVNEGITAGEHLDKALARLKDLLENTDEQQAALKDMVSGMRDLTAALKTAAGALQQMYAILSQAKSDLNPVYDETTVPADENAPNYYYYQMRQQIRLLNEKGYEYDQNGEQVFETDSAGVEITDSAGNKIPKYFIVSAEKDAEGNVINPKYGGYLDAMDHYSVEIQHHIIAIQYHLDETNPPKGYNPDFCDGEPNTTEADKINGHLRQILEDTTFFMVYAQNASGCLSIISEDLQYLQGQTSGIVNHALDKLDAQVKVLSDALSAASGAADRVSAAAKRLEQATDWSDLDPVWDELDLSSADLKKAAADLKTGMSELDKTIELLKQTVDAAESFDPKFKALADRLEAAGQQAKTVYQSVQKLTEKFTSIPAVKVSSLSGALAQSSNDLDASLDELISQANRLNEVTRSSGSTLVEDGRAINRQMGVIIDTLRSLTNSGETQSARERFEDISRNGTADRTEGVVAVCSNSGEVRGDSNVAGVVGALSVEQDINLEEDVQVVGSRSLEFTYQVCLVVMDCVNNGAVTSRKDKTGGVVGLMDYGYLCRDQNYGDVTSSGGDYVGGIVGKSSAAVDQCWAKCVLSGGDYVGGVAGWGREITDCRTMVEITGGTAFLGAVAGDADSEGTVTGNLYLSETLGGVDGISREAAARPVSFETLASLSGTPDRFRELQLTFTADGKTVAVVPFLYGEGIDSLPAIPAKDGHSARWPAIDYTHLTYSQTVEAEYIPYSTALADSEALPNLLVDGSFSSGAAISQSREEVTFTDAKGKEHSGTAWTVTVLDPTFASPDCTVHYRKPDVTTKYRVWVKNGDAWEKIDHKVDGSYLLIDCPGGSVTFLAEPVISQGTAWRIAGCLGGGAALLVLLALMCRALRRRKAAKAARTVPQDGPEQNEPPRQPEE